MDTTHGSVKTRRTGGGPSRVEQFLNVGSLITTILGLYERYRKVEAALRERSWYTITVSETDPIWADLQDRVLGLIPSPERRSLTATFARDLADDPITLWHNGGRTLTVDIGGHNIDITIMMGVGGKPVRRLSIFEESTTTVTTTGPTGDTELGNEPAQRRREYRTLQFDCPTVDARDAVTEWIREAAVARRNREHPPEFHIATRWGYWENLPPAARREPSTVILADNLMDDLIADVGDFLSAREWYEERCIPWHRGWQAWRQRSEEVPSLRRRQSLERLAQRLQRRTH